MSTSKRVGKPFQPGNTFGKGRAAGSRNKVSLLAEQLLEGDAEAIVRKIIERAKKGDPVAMRLCMERLCPPRREQPMRLDLPEIVTSTDVHAAFQVVVQGVAQGDLTPDQAEHVTNILEFGRKSIETGELARGLEEVRTELRDLKEKYERRAA